MRTSGVLMHLTSLPAPYGIGTMGSAARTFLDFLVDAGQTYWQILPIGPTSFGDSPYQAFSTFAGNPYLIDLDDLCAEGLLRKEEYDGVNWGEDPEAVDYGVLYNARYPILRKAVQRLNENLPEDYEEFLSENENWLPDYALFMALKDANKGKSWQQWPDPLRLRDPRALADARKILKDEVSFWQGVQYLFFHQWAALKRCAHEKGIRFIGDLPIYVALDSADVWSRPEEFQLDEEFRPKEVAGVPPDGFSADGQLWGNPLFDWEYMEREGFSWWIDRVRQQKAFYDVLRIDHFRGFESYYAVPYGDKNAKRGKWKKGPGMSLFRAIEKALGKQEIIAEDLGFLTKPVREMLRDSGFPGMKVLHFAFTPDAESDYLPHQYAPGCVCYVGTHDNDTSAGWLKNGNPREVAFARKYLKLTEEEGEVWGLMRGALASPADTVVLTAQDLLGLGSEARMNAPSTQSGNWRWRALPGAFDEKLAKRLRDETGIYFRLPKKEKPEQDGADRQDGEDPAPEA